MPDVDWYLMQSLQGNSVLNMLPLVGRNIFSMRPLLADDNFRKAGDDWAWHEPNRLVRELRKSSLMHRTMIRKLQLMCHPGQS